MYLQINNYQKIGTLMLSFLHVGWCICRISVPAFQYSLQRIWSPMTEQAVIASLNVYMIEPPIYVMVPGVSLTMPSTVIVLPSRGNSLKEHGTKKRINKDIKNSVWKKGFRANLSLNVWKVSNIQNNKQFQCRYIIFPIFLSCFYYCRASLLRVLILLF